MEPAKEKTVFITDQDWRLLQFVEENELVSLAAELDICAPMQIDARALWEQCVVAIAARAKSDGVPLSKYDHEDVAALTPSQLQTLAGLQGSRATVSAILKAGARAYRRYERSRPSNPIALHTPSLLAPILRAAAAVK